MALTMRNYRTFLLNQAVTKSKVSANTIMDLTTEQLRLAFNQGIVDYRIALTFILTKQKLTTMATQKNKTSKAATTRKARVTAKEYAKKHLKGMGAVAAIVALGKKKYTQKEIIEAGYNKNTVYRQYREQVMA